MVNLLFQILGLQRDLVKVVPRMVFLLCTLLTSPILLVLQARSVRPRRCMSRMTVTRFSTR